MQQNPLGGTGLMVPALSFGLGGMSGVEDFDRKVDLCLEAGIRLFDTSDVYSEGRSEALLGDVLKTRRSKVLLSTKTTHRVGTDPNDVGSSRYHIIEACEASLRRLKRDWIDLYQLHVPDRLTRQEETLRAMDDLVRSGKVRYIGCSNFSAWHVMQALAISKEVNLHRYAFQQIYYSLACRDSELELLPLAIDQNMGTMVWGALAFGFLSGKYQRNAPKPEGSRLEKLPELGHIRDWDHAYRVLDAARAVAEARNVSVGQVAMNWLLRKPWVSTVIIGARLVSQLEDMLSVTTWTLSKEEVEQLDKASEQTPPYPYWLHRIAGAEERNPPLKGYRP